MRSTRIKAFVVSAVLIGLAGITHAQFVAVNDHGSGPGTAPNTTRYNVFGAEDGTSGPLKDVNSGAVLPVTITITRTGLISGEQLGANPPAGSALLDAFTGLVDFANNPSNNNINLPRGGTPIPPAGVVTHTIANLDPTKKYILQGGATRGDASFTDRWTLFRLSGADAFVSAHHGGLTTAQVPAIANNEIAINTGIRTGDMFEWREVNPGSDGTIQIICRAYTGTVPGGSSGGPGGYSMTALKVVEAVITAPVIVSQPETQVVNLGDSATFSVGATGYPLNYQWLRDGVVIPGATGSRYTIPTVTANDENVGFSVRISNQLGTVTSEEAFLAILREDLEIIPWGKTWRYEVSGSNLGTSWKDVDFGDSGWLSGAGPLGYENSTLPVPLVTTFASNSRITYYFRTTFVFNGEPSDVTLNFTNMLDDGVVYYLNGHEILRVGMPDGPVDSSTAAGRTVGNAALEYSLNVTNSYLLPGTNVLAAEAHQINTTSSDLVMGVNIWAKFLPPGPLSITSQPQDLTVEELKVATFSVGVEGNGARFQWLKDGNPIEGATRSIYTIPAALLGDQGSYSVRVRNAFSSLTSQAAMLTVIPDTNGPVILEADGSMSSTNILVSFSEKISEETATNRANYRLTTSAMSPNLTVYSAFLTNNGTAVLLTTGSRAQGSNYVIVVNNLIDLAPSANEIAEDSMAPVISLLTLLDFWDVWRVYDPFIPFDPAYPGDGWNNDPSFNATAWGTGGGPFVYNAPNNELPVDARPLYFSLSQGSTTKYFRTGFTYAASLLGASFRMRHMVDDGVIMYLNGQEFHRFNVPEGPVLPTTPGNPTVGVATLVDVADIPTELLRAGTNLMAVELHGTSASDLDWVFGLDFQVRVKSFIYGPVLITTQPEDQTVMEGQPVTFSFDGVGPSRYQWYRNGQAISGATNPTYTILSTPLAFDMSGFHVIAQNISANKATSSVARLTVLVDDLPPEIVSAYATADLNSILVSFNEFLDPTTATAPGNYTITNDQGHVPVNSAILTNGNSVLLLTDPLPLGRTVVMVNRVKDTSEAGNTILPGWGAVVGFQGVIISRDDTWSYDDTKQNWFAENEWVNNGFNDSGWLSGDSVFVAEDSNPAGEAMPPGWTFHTAMEYDTGANFVTNYFFRKRLSLPVAITGTVTVTNILDDGGVFFLNGNEVANFRLPTARPLTITTLSAGRTDDVGSAANPYDVFTLDGSAFIAGDNIIAVTVHQSSGTSSDAVFGSEWFLDVPSEVIRPPVGCPELTITREGNEVVISWESSACTLYQASDLGGAWTPVPGQANPYRVTPGQNNPAKFYQLRQ